MVLLPIYLRWDYVESNFLEQEGIALYTGAFTIYASFLGAFRVCLV